MTWITRAVLQDAPALGQLMYRSVREGALKYSVAQRVAWMPRVPAGRLWARKLASQSVWVARSSSAKPIGFVSVRDDGYVDLAFVAPHMLGKGVFSALIGRVIAESGGQNLHTHASLHAQPAFAAYGFKVASNEVVIRHGQSLRRAFMNRD